MRRILSITLIMFLSCSLMGQEYEYTYGFFTNSMMKENYFFSSVISSGGSVIKAINGKLPVALSRFHTPGNALELQYMNSASGNWQAAVYHKEIRGMDHFRDATALSVWMYDASPEAAGKGLPEVQLMRKDSSLTSAVPLNGRAGEWQQIRIPLEEFGISNSSEAFQSIAVVFSSKGTDSGKLRTIYIDDIEFITPEKSPNLSSMPEISDATGYAMHVDISWKKVSDPAVKFIKIYRSEDGRNFNAVGVQYPFISRFADFTGETGKKYWYCISYLNTEYNESDKSPALEASTHPMSDDELLTMVQQASFRYYWEGCEASSGLAREDVPGRHNMIASGASGFGIMALIAGTERGFISRDESVKRFGQITDFLSKAETFHGAYPHFIDGATGKVEPFFGNEDNGADLVETSFLMQGLLAARQYFDRNNNQEKEIRDRITRIWGKVEWDWFRQRPNSKFLYWHWSPDQAWIINHNLIGWNETMVTYLLAIASPTHAVPASMYYSGWANQDSTGQKYRSAWGQTTDGSMYSNGKTYYGIKLDVGVSNGGPLFFTHYSYMGYDPHYITDKYTNYFTNNQNIARINYNYCVENPKKFKGYGPDGWGLTASDGPFDYSADEPVMGQDHGKLAPTGAISSFPYTPVESMQALKSYYYTYGSFLWGEYGFRDAFDLTNNWCSDLYMGLNQAPMTVMIENYRTGLIWNLFMKNPEIKEGLKKLEKESK